MLRFAICYTLATATLIAGQQDPDRLPQPVPVDSTWRVVAIPSTPLKVRLPAAYRPRNEYGCFLARTDGVMFGPGWRDVCIFLMSDREAAARSFHRVTKATRDADPCVDCMTYEGVRTYTIRLGGRQAVVDRGFGTGSIHHVSGRREMLVRLFVGSDSLTVIYAIVGDENDEAEVLAIASTVLLEKAR